MVRQSVFNEANSGSGINLKKIMAAIKTACCITLPTTSASASASASAVVISRDDGDNDSEGMELDTEGFYTLKET